MKIKHEQTPTGWVTKLIGKSNGFPFVITLLGQLTYEEAIEKVAR